MPVVHRAAVAATGVRPGDTRVVGLGGFDVALIALRFRVLLADFRANLIALEPLRSAIRAMALNDR
jgi:hypothetical protein